MAYCDNRVVFKNPAVVVWPYDLHASELQATPMVYVKFAVWNAGS